ncbi:MAG: VWA domain-containing protein [Deltaproteobacteria bacterium]|nr:VWA domain-containing protein [Deltaproteobacteria bacterium]
MIVVLVDMSGSTNSARRTVYREAFEKIFQDLRQGDRIMVGTITGRSFIDFKPVVDSEIPKKSIWVNRIQFEQKLTNTREEIRREVEKLLSRKRGTPRTEILNSLNIADTIFHDEKRKKILVILSDMIQDSKEYNFSTVKVTDDYIYRVIRRRQELNLIPDLSGVKVYVAGASASDSKKFRSVERFWARYFEKAGADFSHHRYGHSLISFEGRF